MAWFGVLASASSAGQVDAALQGLPVSLFFARSAGQIARAMSGQAFARPSKGARYDVVILKKGSLLADCSLMMHTTLHSHSGGNCLAPNCLAPNCWELLGPCHPVTDGSSRTFVLSFGKEASIMSLAFCVRACSLMASSLLPGD